MHQVGLEPEAGFAGTGAADDQHILISGVLGILGPVTHHQTFRLREYDVVFKHRIDKGLDVLCRSPAGGTVLNVLAVFLGVLAFHIDRQPQGCTTE